MCSQFQGVKNSWALAGLWLKGRSALIPMASRGRSGPSKDKHFENSSGQRARKDSEQETPPQERRERSKSSLNPLRRAALCPVTSSRMDNVSTAQVSK